MRVLESRHRDQVWSRLGGERDLFAVELEGALAVGGEVVGLEVGAGGGIGFEVGVPEGEGGDFGVADVIGVGLVFGVEIDAGDAAEAVVEIGDPDEEFVAGGTELVGLFAPLGGLAGAGGAVGGAGHDEERFGEVGPGVFAEHFAGALAGEEHDGGDALVGKGFFWPPRP